MLLKILFLTLIIALIISLLWKMRRYLGRLVLILLFLGIVFLIYKGINPQNAQQFQTQIHHHLSSSWQQLSTWITDETTPQLSDTIASTHEDNSTAQTQFSRFAQFFASESSSTETSEHADISHSESESASPEINNDPTLILSDHNEQKDQNLILEDDPFASRESIVINELPTEQAIITLWETTATKDTTAQLKKDVILEDKPRIDDKEVIIIPSNPQANTTSPSDKITSSQSNHRSSAQELSTQDLQEAAMLFNL